MANQQLESNHGMESKHHAFEADAVCAQCATVNPEGTLMCKTCGNNLRVQREVRLSAAQLAGSAAHAGEKSGWLSKAFAVLGLLIVLWAVLNVSDVADFLVNAQEGGNSGAQLFWSGATSEVYDELLAQLDANPVTAAEAEAAQATPYQGKRFEGRYVVLQENDDLGRRKIGTAIVSTEGDRLLFVGRFARNMELRGNARIEEGSMYVARQSIGVRMRNDYFLAAGYANREEIGILRCYGESEINETSHTVWAYRIAEDAQ